ncbi:MAG: biopolymer transporter ExbD [Bacteroidota bacterium]
MPKREQPEINASSMADIAFLLLIFFLVTTTIDVDSGITVKLPPWSEEPPETQKLKTRNVFSVLVNAQDELLVRGELERLADLKEKAKEFISNPTKRGDLAEDPKKAIISLKNDRGTSYGAYLTVYNELKAAYNEIYEEESQKRFGGPYDDLPNDKKKEIRADIPLVISEAEPTDFGEQQ